MLLVTVMKSNLPCDWGYSGKNKNKKKTGVFDITNISLSAQPSQHFPTIFGGIFIPGYLTINRHIKLHRRLFKWLNKSDIVRFTSWVTTAFGCLLNKFK